MNRYRASPTVAVILEMGPSRKKNKKQGLYHDEVNNSYGKVGAELSNYTNIGWWSWGSKVQFLKLQ